MRGSNVVTRGIDRLREQFHEPSLRMQCSPLAADLLKDKPIHASQQLTKKPDGTAELTMNVALNRVLERIVLGWSAEVRVLEPSRSRISSRLQPEKSSRGRTKSRGDRPPRPMSPGWNSHQNPGGGEWIVTASLIRLARPRERFPGMIA
jgi:hypothetical protein